MCWCFPSFPCSPCSPCLHIQDGRMEQFLEPWHVWCPRSPIKTALSPKFGPFFKIWRCWDKCVRAYPMFAYQGPVEEAGQKAAQAGVVGARALNTRTCEMKMRMSSRFRSNQKLVFPLFLTNQWPWIPGKQLWLEWEGYRSRLKGQSHWNTRLWL